MIKITEKEGREGRKKRRRMEGGRMERQAAFI